MDAGIRSAYKGVRAKMSARVGQVIGRGAIRRSAGGDRRMRKGHPVTDPECFHDFAADRVPGQ